MSKTTTACDDPEKLLEHVHALAAKRLRACNVAAKAKGLVLVDVKRYEALEQLVRVVTEAFSKVNATMTRDYKDVQQSEGITYGGKKWLINRNAGYEVYQQLSKLTDMGKFPSGCLINPSEYQESGNP